MRRLMLEQPVSAAAIWARRFDLFGLALAGAALAMTRKAGIDPAASLAVFGAAIVMGLLAFLCGIISASAIWRHGRRGAGIVFSAFIMAALLLAAPAFMAVQAVRLPLINDISTDLIDPPEFSLSSRALAARDGFIHGALSEASREAQRIAYPSVQPILLDVEADDAWLLVQKAAAARGWRIVEQTKPGGRTGAGRIDAIDRTLVMRFFDDVTIRVRPLAGQTRIDVRSASRIGRHDFGANAKRIQSFSEELQAALDAR